MVKRSARPTHTETGDLLARLGYRVEQEIGSGGLGVVFRATAAQSGSPVAVKVVPPSVAASYETVRELPVHEALIRVLDRGVLANGSGFIVMPLLGRGSLADLLRDGPLPSGSVGHIGFRLSGALHALHSSGIVHGDVTPANVLFGEEGEPVLADLGLAQTVDDAGVAIEALGFTMAYASPEVVSTNELTPMSDIFSLGATLFAACTGRPPWLRARFAAGQTLLGVRDAQLGEDSREFLARVHDELDAREVDLALGRVILAALSHDFMQRPDAATMREALAGYATRVDGVAVQRPVGRRTVGLPNLPSTTSEFGVLISSADAVLDQITFTRLRGTESEELRPISLRLRVADRADEARFRSAVRRSFLTTGLGTAIAALATSVSVLSGLPGSLREKGLLVGSVAAGLLVPTLLTAVIGRVRRRWESSRAIDVKRSRVKLQAAFVEAIRDASLTGEYTT